MTGRTISHYRVLAQLGAGGMGVVYQTESLRLGRMVALKMLSDHLSNPTAIERFERDAPGRLPRFLHLERAWGPAP